ncbi:hypothetical protein [Sphingobium sp. KCTC 72723]|uniref:phage tail tip fiber protein n=1 Tax=Sphingobium sp. KCTC 72723 TaxID=2733867 RepID=UPI00165E9E11|nr:hypothetical protein [Sphingobium sp. KCTC 72723]
MAIEFTGRDLVTWFREHPSNGQEWQYRLRYECVNSEVVHYLNHTVFQSVDADGMRVYKDALTFEENVAAGLTRSPKVYLATQIAGGKWSAEREIAALNPAPPVPAVIPMHGYDMAVLSFQKPADTDFAGFVVWADTQTPVRKSAITSKYLGPDTTVTLPLAPDTEYFITYAAYDAFGTDLLNEATIRIHTLSVESKLLPILNEKLEGVAALNVQRSTAFGKLANAYGKQNERRIQKAVEKLYTDIDNGTLISGKMLELESKFDDFDAVFGLYQETQAGVDFAQSQQLLQMGAKFENFDGDVLRLIEGVLVEERKVYVDADKALTLRLDQQASRIGDNESQFNDKIETLVDADTALAKRITDQSAVWNSDISGAITAAQQTINETIANEREALSRRIDTLSAQIGDGEDDNGWESALEEVKLAYAAADKTNADNIITLSSRLNDQGGVTLEQKLSTYGSAIDGFGGQYTLRIDNQGRVGGYGLYTDASQNFEFAVNADRFAIGHPGGTEMIFEAVAGQIRMKQAIIARATIDGAQINDLSVNTLKIAGNAITANQVMTAEDALCPAGGTIDFLVTPFMTIGDGVTPGNGTITVTLTRDATVGYDASCIIRLLVDTGSGYSEPETKTIGITTDNGNTYSRTSEIIEAQVTGTQVRVIARMTSGTFLPRSVSRIQYARDIMMTLKGAKK